MTRVQALATLRWFGDARAALYEPVVPTPDYLAYLDALERECPPDVPPPDGDASVSCAERAS